MATNYGMSLPAAQPPIPMGRQYRDSSGGNGLAGLLGLFGGLGTGGMGFLPTLGLQFGGSLLKGLSGLLGGKSDAEKRAEQVFALAKNRLGQSVLEPEQFMAQYQRSLAPQFTQEREKFAKMAGIESPWAFGEYARNKESTLSGLLAKLNMLNAQLTTQKDLGLLSTMLRTSAVGR